MQTGADRFIRNTKAAEKPVHFSPTTKAGIRMTHNASVKTVKVAKTTLGKINDVGQYSADRIRAIIADDQALSVVAEKAYTTTVEPAVDYYQTNSKIRKSFSSDRKPSPPPVPPRLPANSSSPMSEKQAYGSAAAPPPYRQPSPLSSGTSTPNKPPVPPKPAGLALDTRLSQLVSETKPAANMSLTPESAQASPDTHTPSSASSAKKRPFLNRLLLAGEVVLTSLEATAQDLITNGTTAASTAAGHKFGPEAGHATALLGGSVRNVAVVYIDVRGIGRKALLTGTAKGFVKARLKNGETVQIQAGGVQGPDGVAVDAGEAEIAPGGQGTVVVGMPQVGTGSGVAAVQGAHGGGGRQGMTSVDRETLEMLDRMK